MTENLSFLGAEIQKKRKSIGLEKSSIFLKKFSVKKQIKSFLHIKNTREFNLVLGNCFFSLQKI